MSEAATEQDIMLKITYQILALCFLAQSVASAKLIMPVTFGDGMVLQRDTAVTVFGEASEGASITVRLNGAEKKTSSHAVSYTHLTAADE